MLAWLQESFLWPSGPYLSSYFTHNAGNVSLFRRYRLVLTPANMPPFRVNEVIWAKIRGYPNWPARVLDPADGASVKVTRRKNMYFVRFLSADEGKQTVSWVPEDGTVYCILPDCPYIT